jgi:hypothetical protein
MSRTKRLKNARKKRTQASRVLAHLEAGEVTIETLLSAPDYIGHVRLFTLMKRTPGLGEAGIKKCLFKAKVYPMTRVDELTDTEISRVIHYLPPRVKR